MSEATTPAVVLDQVTVRYRDRTALDDITMTVTPGSYVGLVGPNGSGKTTLLRAILGIAPLSEGEILIGGASIGSARDLLAYVPQRQRVDWDFPLTIRDAVMMGRLRRIGWFRRPAASDHEAVEAALQRVRLLDRRNSLIGELSGGQQQRAFLARALAQEGHILLLDEPLTGMDSTTQELVEALMGELHQEGRTIIIATHDLNFAACHCDSLCLLNGRLIAYGPIAETFTPELLRQTYGEHVHFLEAAPGELHPQVMEDIHHH